MTHLVPCPHCDRHVKTLEPSCPFCGGALALGHLAPPPVPATRLGRAATFAFSATLLGASAVAGCGGESERDEGSGGRAGTAAGGNAGTNAGGSGAGGDGGTSAGGSAGTSFGGSAGVGLLYGAPPAGMGGDGGTAGTSSGGSGMDTGGSSAGGSDTGGSDTGGSSAGGGDTGGSDGNGGFAGTVAPPYGIPADAGIDDDGGGSQPEYGAPPAEGGF